MALRARPTMHDVAALAGVSLKTVSRVVNGEPGVSADLVARVNRAAAQLDYRPNLAASSLRRTDGKTATIGLLLEDVANPFSSAVHRAIEDAARRRGVAVFASSLDEDPERERQLTRAFVSRRVDGLIIVPAGPDQSYLLSDRRAGLALVFIDRPPAFLDADTVLAANRDGARTGVATCWSVATGGWRIWATCGPSAPHGSGSRDIGAHSGMPASPSMSDWSGMTCAPSSAAELATATSSAGDSGRADGALHEPEPDHHRRAQGAARPGTAALGRPGRL